MLAQSLAQTTGSRSAAISAPEPDLTPEALIARAVALRPKLIAQQDANDLAGTYSTELHEDFVRAGFYRTLQPRYFGGYEFDYETFTRLQIQIGRGHPGVAWCLGLASSHAVTIASHWSEEAQREIFGTTGHIVAPHRAVPSGTIVKVKGGYEVDGIWRYASGVPFSTHFIGTTLVPNDNGEPLSVNFVVPRDAYEVLDDWGGDRVLGLRASGSNSVKLSRVYVPEHLVTPYVAEYTRLDFSQGTPGTRLHRNPIYLGQAFAPYNLSITAPIVGAARAALDEYEASMRTQQTVFPPYVPRLTHQDFQRNFGYAIALTDAAEALLYAVCRQHKDLCARWASHGTPISLDENVRLLGMCQTAGRLACEAVELLFRTAGSANARRGAKLARYFTDASMYRTHGAEQPLEFAAVIGRVNLGLPAQFLDL
jgi:3-hydroxy-9,10-secoandrosta-1,3,5(10)-triene-9,17-dione monooxygenase